MITKNDIAVFVKHCESVLDLKNAKDACAGLYQNLPLCLLDAVYSMGVRYGSTRKVTARYAAYYGIQATNANHTVSEFLKNIENAGGAKIFAENVLNNRQRTATRNGIIKSESCKLVAEELKKRGIETISNFNDYPDKEDLDRAICATKSQSSGIMLKYLYMLAGDENMVKPDRMICRFIQSVLSHIKDHEDMVSLIREAAEELKSDYPTMCARALDHCIWEYQRKIKVKPKKPWNVKKTACYINRLIIVREKCIRNTYYRGMVQTYERGRAGAFSVLDCGMSPEDALKLHGGEGTVVLSKFKVFVNDALKEKKETILLSEFISRIDEQRIFDEVIPLLKKLMEDDVSVYYFTRDENIIELLSQSELPTEIYKSTVNVN